MSKTAVMTYSALGHAYFHMFTAFYFVIVLSLEAEWQLPYHQLVNLWTPGALLVGVFALVAGWLGDRWSATGMLAVYFIGMGLSAVAAGYVGGPTGMLIALAGLGLFAAIYHPIGIPLVIRNSGARQGMALAVNGIFGSLGAAMAGVVTGFLADAGGSFLAFVLPGAIVTATGVLMLAAMLRARAAAGTGAAIDAAGATNKAFAGGWGLPFFILLFCLTAAGLVYHTTQTVMPKAFSLRIAGADLKTVGFYVAVVYGGGGLFQFVGGALADKYNLKRVYLGQYVLHAVLLLTAAYTGGLWLVLILCAAVSLGAGVLPAENMLLARYTPRKHHGLVFGLKFVLFFGSGPIGVLLVAGVHQVTGQFIWVFLTMFITAVLICAAAVWLPRRAPAIA